MDETIIYEPNLILLRSTRDQLLTQTDKYLLADFPITPENLILIKEYRQKLRDFSNNNFIIPEFPF